MEKCLLLYKSSKNKEGPEGSISETFERFMFSYNCNLWSIKDIIYDFVYSLLKITSNDYTIKYYIGEYHYLLFRKSLTIYITITPKTFPFTT